MHGTFHAFEFLIFPRRAPHPFLELTQEIVAIIGGCVGRPCGDFRVERIGGNHRDRFHDSQIQGFRTFRLETWTVDPSEKCIIDKCDQQHHEQVVLAKRDRGGRSALPIVAHQRLQQRPAAQRKFRLEVHLRDKVVATVNIQREMLCHSPIGDGLFIPADKMLPPENQHGVARLQHPCFTVHEIMPTTLQADNEIVHLIGFVDLPGAGVLHLDRGACEIKRERRRRNGRENATFDFVHLFPRLC
ncbi:hypothetical protein D3C87_1506220 [compost metagenome]